MSEEELDLSKLSLNDRLSHKNWKARQSGYEELFKLFQTLPLDEPSGFEAYESFLKGMAGDANQIAQENGIKTVLVYVKSCSSAARVQSTIVPLVVEKCLPSSRAGTRSNASELLLTFVEIDNADIVVDTLLSMFNHKTPKTVSSAVSMLREIISQYGYPTVNIKPILKKLTNIFDHRDKNVRAEATNLAIEMYKWMGPALLPSLNELKPVQLKELTAAFESLPQDRPSPQRYRRADQKKMASAAIALTEKSSSSDTNAQPSSEPAKTAQPVVDAYDFADPVSFLDKISKSFHQDLASTKWKERKEALESLLALVSAPKLEDGRYHELVNALAKRVADVNIIVAVIATNCLEKMAYGLRHNFSQYRSIVVGPLVERTKEKKLNVLEALRGALDALFHSCSFLDLLEDMLSSFSHKNPQTKTEGLQWFTRCLKSGKILKKDLTKELKTVSEALLKVLDDGTDQVRDAGAEAFAMLIIALSERPLIPYLERLDKTKKAKVNDYVSKHQESTSPSVSTASSASTLQKQTVLVNRSSAKPKMSSSTTPSSGSAPNNEAKNKSAPQPTKRSTPGVSIPKSASAPAMSSLKAESDETVSFKFTDDSAESYMKETFATVSVEDLVDSNWKNRLAAAQSLSDAIATKLDQASDLEAEGVIEYLSKKPGFKEINFQVMGSIIGIYTKLASCATFNRACATMISGGVFEKIGDMKLKKSAGECLNAIVEAISFGFVLRFGLPILEKQKSPKVISEGISFISEALKLFGTKSVDVHGLAKFVMTCLGNANAAVRTQSIGLIGTLAGLLGEDVRFIFKDLPAQQQSLVDAEIDKALSQPRIQPTRAPISKAPSKINAPGASQGQGRTQQLQQVIPEEEEEEQSLFPRVDLSSRIPSSLLEQLGSAAWKERKAALDELIGIIKGTNMRIQPNLGFDFIQALKARLTDSNKNLACQTVDICAMLTTAMGKPFEKHLRNLLPSILSHLSDQKQMIRTLVVNALTKMITVIPITIMLPAVSTALAAEQPVLRKELLKWLSDSLSELSLSEAATNVQDFECLVHPLLLCFQDRNGDVRKGAQVVASSIAPVVGISFFKEKATEFFKGAALASLQPFLESIRSSSATAETSSQSSHTQGKSLSATATGHGTPSRPQKSEAHRLLSNTKQTLKRTNSVKVGSKKDDVSQKRPTEVSENSVDGTINTLPTSNDQVVLLTSDPKPKESRANADRGLNKWAFDSVRRELVEFLAEQAAPHIVPLVHGLLFSSDHYKEKDHLSGLKALDDFIANPSYSGLDVGDIQMRVISNCDLILKYLTIRFFDTNTVILNKSLEVLDHMLNVLDDASYCLSEYEAASFLPFFVTKAGDAKETIRVKVRAILKKMGRVYPISKLFGYVMKGLESKNARTRTECLEELSNIIQRNGQSAFSPSKSLPVIAAQVGDRDANVRNGALNALTQAFKLLGEGLWKHLSKLSEKDKALVAERLRRVQSSGEGPIIPTETATTVGSAALASLSDQASRSVAHLKNRLARSKVHEALPSRDPLSDVTEPLQVKREFSLDLEKLALNGEKSTLSNNADSISAETKARSGSALSSSKTLSGAPLSSLKVSAKASQPQTENQSNTGSSINLDKYRAVLGRGLTQSASSISSAEIEEADLSALMSSLLDRVGGNNPADILDALKQLEKHLAVSTHTLIVRISQLVGILSLQMNTVLVGSLSSDPAAVKVGKNLIMVLVQVFSNESSAKLVSTESLEACIQEVVIRLVDPTLSVLDPTGSISRALNMLMVRIIEKSDPNNTISILLKSLRKSADDCLGKTGDDLASQARLTELIMKCLWKQTKTIQTLLSSQQLKPSRLLADIDVFLTLSPPQEWKRRVAEGVIDKADMPWRTVRTILHELVNYYGDGILNFTTELPHPMSSHTISTLKQMLQSGRVKKRIDSTTGTPIKSGVDLSRHSQEGMSHQQLQSSPSDAVMQIEKIVAKISNKEQTKEGVRELYEYKKNFPGTMPIIRARISQMSTFIQSYIERSFNALEKEEEQAYNSPVGMPKADSVSSFTTVSSAVSINTPGGLATAIKSDADTYQDKLAHLKERFNNRREMTGEIVTKSRMDDTSSSSTPLRDTSSRMNVFSVNTTDVGFGEKPTVSTTSASDDFDRDNVVAGLKSRLAKLKMKMDSAAT